MKLFSKYFKPYAEYCLQTTFSEAELKKVFEKEFSSIYSFAAFKSGFYDHGVTFYREYDPLKLHLGVKKQKFPARYNL